MENTENKVVTEAKEAIIEKVVDEGDAVKGLIAMAVIGAGCYMFGKMRGVRQGTARVNTFLQGALAGMEAMKNSKE